MSLATAAWRQCVATIASHADAGAGHRWLALDLPADTPGPDAGQFVQLTLPSPAPVFLPRPMSIAGARRTARALRLTFLYAAVGAGTHALAGLPAGTRLEVLGPLGRGYPLEEPGTPVLVAGGRGVAPLLFAAEALARRGVRAEFVFGARTKAQLVALDEARTRLARAGGRLHLATEDGSRGVCGNVLDVLDALAPRLARPVVVHACGPHGMLKALALRALARGERAHLAMESVMACGTGVCRGCPLPRSREGRAAFDPDATPSLYGNREFAMCCTEGPVFEARALDWERVE